MKYRRCRGCTAFLTGVFVPVEIFGYNEKELFD
jgi:hypothetical protein